jgi:hypothetical protein
MSFFAAWLAMAPCAEAGLVRRSAQRLPAATKAYVSLSQEDAARNQWSRTRLSELTDAPALQPFRAQLQQQWEQKQAKMERTYGLTLDDLLAVSVGECAVGAVEAPGEQLTLMFLVEVGDDLSAVHNLLRDADARLMESKAIKTERIIGGVAVAHYQVPQADETVENVLYFVRDGVLGVGADVAVATELLEHWDAAEGKLATLPAFQDVMQRVMAEDPKWDPPIVFFADPLRLDELLDPPELLANGMRRPTLAVKHGWDAIRGIGGAMGLAERSMDVLYRMAVHAPPPYERAMQILDFPVGDDFAPPVWAPDYLNSFATLYWRVEKIIEHIGPVFDDVAANDETGAFDDIYRDVKTELNVDLKELFARLGPRVDIASDALPEVSSTSQRDFFAVEIKPGQEATVAEEIARLLRDDPTVERIVLQAPRREGSRITTETCVLWRVGEAGGLGDRKGFTAAGVMAARGHLFLATNYKVLETMFSPEGQLRARRLADAHDFQTAMRHLSELSSQESCARVFARTDRDFRTTYELLRHNQLEDAETMYARAITLILEQLDDNDTQLEFDTLPAFEEIAPFLGQAAIDVRPQPKGWLIVGFVKPE